MYPQSQLLMEKRSLFRLWKEEGIPSRDGLKTKIIQNLPAKPESLIL